MTNTSLDLTVDVYSVLNLIDRRWGLYRSTAPTPAWPMLRLKGYDATAGRGVYGLKVPGNQIQGEASRWQVEVSVRYVFKAGCDTPRRHAHRDCTRGPRGTWRRATAV